MLRTQFRGIRCKTFEQRLKSALSSSVLAHNYTKDNVEFVRIGQPRIFCVKDTWILYHSMADRAVSSQITGAAITKINQKTPKHQTTII